MFFWDLRHLNVRGGKSATTWKIDDHARETVGSLVEEAEAREIVSEIFSDRYRRGPKEIVDIAEGHNMVVNLQQKAEPVVLAL